MKEWHVLVLDGHKRIYDKIFFNIKDAKVALKEMEEKYAQEIKDRKYQVMREYY